MDDAMTTPVTIFFSLLKSWWLALGKWNKGQVTLLGEEVKKSVKYGELQKKCHSGNYLASNGFMHGNRMNRVGINLNG